MSKNRLKTCKGILCVYCDKSLINLSNTEELEKGISQFWCDDCNVEYTIKDNSNDPSIKTGSLKINIKDLEE